MPSTLAWYCELTGRAEGDFGVEKVLNSDGEPASRHASILCPDIPPAASRRSTNGGKAAQQRLETSKEVAAFRVLRHSEWMWSSRIWTLAASKQASYNLTTELLIHK